MAEASGVRRRKRGAGTGSRTTRRTVLTAATAALTGAVLPSCRMGEESGGQGASPFTGEQGRGAHVLAVKVDNVPAARPHTGLEHADIVYTEQVEAGLSRILAVFASRIPATVGPVRSARESDIELLRQFGEPALAFSGVQRTLLPTLEASPLHLLPPAELGDGYARDPARRAPHNLYLRARRAERAARGASAPRDIGFRFGAAPEGGRRTAQETVRYPAARFTFTWSPDRRRWHVAMDGVPARTRGHGRLAPATVVIQYVTVRQSRYRDSSGSVTPYTETLGSGEALVLRDGRAYEARWSRLSPGQGTVFTDARGGRRLSFARGQVWISLVRKD
ncbi:DUF3048 domain-containing protein [Streptomyces albus subsp. chlorinus]|uniref:DUF3048 domain-containing protein n=1 Tax=Streptomyces albus TaxID=1888 RepID=UPI00157024C7|nr:DUF3048 domain-containing protein [Streptomyces albus]NSC24334.1 DUF3048 domain-containing protein [Streptomyces albus subsp. chlorinus]